MTQSKEKTSIITHVSLFPVRGNMVPWTKMKAEITLTFYSEKYQAQRVIKRLRCSTDPYSCLLILSWFNSIKKSKCMKRRKPSLLCWTSEFQTRITHHPWLRRRQLSSLIQKDGVLFIHFNIVYWLTYQLTSDNIQIPLCTSPNKALISLICF